MSDLRCQHCDYQLRGIALNANCLRCPECGGVTQLDVLAAELVRRRREARLMHRDIALVAGLGMGMIVLSLVGIRWLISSQGIDFLFSRAGLGTLTALSLFAYAVTTPMWWARPRPERAAVALGAALLLMVVPLPWAMLVAGGWLVLFAVLRSLPPRCCR